MRTTALVAAAGLGLRLGAGRPKAMVTVRGVPLLRHSLTRLIASQVADDIIVLAPPDALPAFTDMVADLTVTVIAGGDLRDDSIRIGVRSLSAEVTHVLVHDAARAFTPPGVFQRVHEALAKGAAAVTPVIPVTDTIAQVASGVDREGRGTVTHSLVRSRLRAVQTPQGFTRVALLRAHEAPVDPDITDDAVRAMRCGYPVITVRGDERAAKITNPPDLLLAEHWADE